MIAAPGRAAETGTIPRSQNVTINLINRLVERGVLGKADADDLIQMAEADAVVARAEAASTQAALAKLGAAPAATAVAPGGMMTAAAPGAPVNGTVRVQYVPEVVKAQLREEIKQEVMTQAREERWATPRAMPDWAARYSLFGDFRLRDEALFYPSGNDNTGAFPNFNAINTGAPFDVTGTVFSPQTNVDRNRHRLRIRTRLGADIDMGEDFTAGLRIATGESNTPVSTNQSLGASGGNFSKYALWLDRAFIKYQGRGPANIDWSGFVGRFENPFFAPTETVWDADVGFDGLALTGKRALTDKITPFATLGAFPVFNTALNFSTVQPSKFKSRDKWLLGGQIGGNVAIDRELNAKVGLGYYFFHQVEGRSSRPFTPVNAQDNGDTDETRPSFAQTGNTYFPLRNIVPNVLNNFGTTNQFQYFGLATPFREVVLAGQVNYDRFEPFRLTLSGEWVTNLGFHRSRIARTAVNNLGPGGAGDFVGGGDAWNLELKLGRATLEQRGDWNAWIGYRQVESDAVVDGFTDSDFGNGGTNLEGFTLGGSFALARRVWLNARWMSASSVAGPVYKNDILQFDFNGKF